MSEVRHLVRHILSHNSIILCIIRFIILKPHHRILGWLGVQLSSFVIFGDISCIIDFLNILVLVDFFKFFHHSAVLNFDIEYLLAAVRPFSLDFIRFLLVNHAWPKLLICSTFRKIPRVYLLKPHLLRCDVLLDIVAVWTELGFYTQKLA